MTLETSRRGFLKGLMAAAGVAAVGIPPEVVAAVAEKMPTRPVTFEAGDLWIRRNGVDRFIGKTLSIFFENEIMDLPMDLPAGSPYRGIAKTGNYTGTIEACVDPEGQNILWDAFVDRSRCEFMLGAGGLVFIQKNIEITDVSIEIGRSGLVTSQIQIFGTAKS